MQYAPGHCLLIPKASGSASMLDLSAEAAAQVLRDVPRLARSAPAPMLPPPPPPPTPPIRPSQRSGPRRAVAKATGCDGVHVWQNNGPAARQEVFHGPTVHVFPRHHGDDISSMMASRQPLPDAEAEQMAAKIRAALEEDEEPPLRAVGGPAPEGERPSREAVDRPRPAYDPGNIFLKIISGDAPSFKVMETEHAVAFLDAFPVWPGHCLIIPKAPGYASMLDLPVEAAEQVLREVPRLARCA